MNPDVKVESQTRSTWAEMGAVRGHKVQHKMWELEIITRRTTNDPDVRVESQTRSTWAEMGAAHQNEQQPKFEKNVYIYIDIFFSKHGWNLEKIVYIYINIFYENIGDVL